MTVYAIFLVKMKDESQEASVAYMKNYGSRFLNGKAFWDAGGKIVAISEADDTPVIEGSWPYTRSVMLSFDSKEKMRQWYDSEEYQSFVHHRHQAADTNAALLESVDMDKVNELVKRLESV